MPAGEGDAAPDAGATATTGGGARSGAVVTPGAPSWRQRLRTGLTRRCQPQYLPDADHVGVLDVVPRRELAVVETGVERDLMQRVAALDRVRGHRDRGRGERTGAATAGALATGGGCVRAAVLDGRRLAAMRSRPRRARQPSMATAQRE